MRTIFWKSLLCGVFLWTYCICKLICMSLNFHLTHSWWTTSLIKRNFWHGARRKRSLFIHCILGFCHSVNIYFQMLHRYPNIAIHSHGLSENISFIALFLKLSPDLTSYTFFLPFVIFSKNKTICTHSPRVDICVYFIYNKLYT
jgi:hypothetical protein